MNRVLCAVVLTLGLAALVGLPTANAETFTIDSADFSFGFGANVNSATQCWALQPVNIPATGYTQGDFTFTPVPVGSKFSGNGAWFNGRVLRNGAADGVSGDGTFSMPITAAYTGSVPTDATNIQLELEITNVSVYGAQWTGAAASLAWTEVGVGTSSPVALKSPALSVLADIRTAANYTQVAWDPSDAYVSLATAATPVTRTFNLGNAWAPVDGIEVMGRVHLSYDVASVPEPGTLLLAATGLFGLLAYAWRKQK